MIAGLIILLGNPTMGFLFFLVMHGKYGVFSAFQDWMWAPLILGSILTIVEVYIVTTIIDTSSKMGLSEYAKMRKTEVFEFID